MNALNLISSIVISYLLLLGSLNIYPNIHQNTENTPASINNNYQTIDEYQSNNYYIGYGFNATNNKAISEPDALYLSNPILDINNAKLQSYIKTFNSSQTIYENNSSTSAKEIAEDYGTILSGNIGGGISIVKLDIDAKFNTSNSLSQIAKEEYSYFAIYAKNNTVILQMSNDDIRNYLSAAFENDLYKVNSISSAKNLFNKYGTHLLQSYILGGIFEMTNYFASDEYKYVKENTTSFNGQVSAGLSSISGGVDFSFNQSYASKDNNSHAVNQYKCTTYGGYTFAGLTIDQAFTYTETAFGAGYIYQIWTDSINDNKNLVIVDVPQSSPMIPLWELLPDGSDYSSQRQYLMEAYIEMCDDAYTKFGEANPDIYPTDINDNDNDISSGLPIIDEIGFDYSIDVENGKQLNSYVEAELDNTQSYSVEKGSKININLVSADLDGKEITFETTNNSLITNFNSKEGSFSIPSNATSNSFFRITIKIDGTKLGDLNFVVKDGFSGGSGTEENPYLISNKEDFIKFTGDNSYWSEDVYFKLANDINLEGAKINMVGTSETPYKGHFDGNYCKIENYFIDANNCKGDSIGLFGVNEGTIENLTIENTESRYSSSERNYLIENSNNISSFFRNAGGVVGYNKGTLSNIHVTRINIKLEFNKSYSGLKNSENYLAMGGICGLNEGVVNDCSVVNTNLMARGDYLRAVYCGGLIGRSNSEKSITRCSVESSSIYSRSGLETSNTTQYAYAGGIVASLEQGGIKDSYVRYINGIENEEKSPRIISLSRGTSTNINLNSCAGGIAGFVYPNTKIETSLSYEVSTFKSNYYIQNGAAPDSRVKSHAGILLGYFDMVGTDVSPLSQYIDNVIIERNGNSPIVQSYQENQIGNINGLTIITSMSYDSLTAAFKSSYWINKDGLPELIIVKPSNDYSQYQFDLSKVKREFYVGEEFSIGDLNIQMYNTSGEIVDINQYKVDSHNFRSDIPGTYTIYIYVYNIVQEYDVTVLVPNIYSINILEEPIKTEYFIGEKFDPTGMKLNVTYEDGSSKIVDKNDFSYTNTALTNGVNTITISYGGLSTTYNVVAKHRDVEKIEIKNLPDQTSYEVGAEVLNFTGLEILVTYKDGATSVVNADDCEFIYSPIVYGKNVIFVIYDGYNSTSFELTGVSSYLDSVYEFVSIVDVLSNAESLSEKFDLIKQAIEIRNEILETSSDNNEFIAASEKLDEEISEYEKIIEKINSDFNSTLEDLTFTL